MKTKFEIWAHLLYFDYSKKARCKIEKWLTLHHIEHFRIPIPWQGELGNKTCAEFIKWYNDPTDTCAGYISVVHQLALKYGNRHADMKHKLYIDVKAEWVNNKQIDTEIPF